MSKSMRVIGSVAGAIFLASAGSLWAADLPSRVAPNEVRVAPDCGPCGCLAVVYDYHRELRSTYGADYDPRNYDTTEPHYYFGPMRAYPRYYVEGGPTPSTCRF
jgi:hypothetical protein